MAEEKKATPKKTAKKVAPKKEASNLVKMKNVHTGVLADVHKSMVDHYKQGDFVEV